MLFPNVYLIMLNYPYCKINVLKTWTASFRAPQNPCSDNWNNLNFVLTLLATATKLNSFFYYFFFIFRKSVWFLGIINFYIYSSYPPLGWITIQNTLHFWTKYVFQELHCIKQNQYLKKTDRISSYRTVLAGAGEHIYRLQNKYTLLQKQHTKSKRSSSWPIQREICFFLFRAL